MSKVSLICVALLLVPPLLGQQVTPSVSWDSLKFLVGKWVGEGNAETGQSGAGYCSLESGLQGKVLLRRNHAEYPATKDRPAIVHDDLMIIYPDKTSSRLRAFYTDNEGNVINYTVSVSNDGKSAVFLGDALPAAPRYRLTYALTQPDRVTVDFEMAPPGKPEQFQKFIGGSLRKSDSVN